jgi:hypothetical protein
MLLNTENVKVCRFRQASTGPFNINVTVYGIGEYVRAASHALSSALPSQSPSRFWRLLVTYRVLNIPML